MANDVTERRRMEDTLRESQQKYATLVNSINGIVWEADAHTLQFSFVSDKAERLLGFPVSRWLGTANFWRDHIHPDDRERATGICAKATQERRDHEFEYRMVAADGRAVWLHDYVTVVVEQGEATKLRGVMVDVTERKRADEALRVSEERTRLILDSMNEAFVVIDINSKIIDWNHRAEVIFGWPYEEILGRDLGETIVPSQHRKAHKKGVRHFLATGEGPVLNRRIEVTALHRDGHEFPVEMTITPIRWEDSYIFSAFVQDISDRKQAEEALRASEDRYHQLLESVPSGIYRSTPEGKFTMVNSALVKMLGYGSREELLNIDIPRDLYLSPEERIASQKHLLMGKKDSNIYRLKKKDGSEIWVEDSSSIEYNEEGKVLYYEGVLRDITKRKQAEEALHLSEERFRDLFDNAPDVYIIFDATGTILDFNQRGLKKLGYTRKQMIGKSCLEIVHPEDLEKAAELIKEIQHKQRSPRNIEWRILTKSGQSLWMSNEFSLMRSPAGELQAIRAVCRDITEKKYLEEVVNRTQRLESAGRVAGQIAHDFNNLLTPLTAYPALIYQELPKSHPVTGMIDEMQVAAQKIAEINQQLLSLARRGHYNFEAVDLNELVERTLFAIKLPAKTVVKQHLAEDLLLMRGGSAQLGRALTNLILNAKEAMNDIGVLTITTENVYIEEPLKGYPRVDRGEYVKLTIGDNGTGISTEVLDKIFEPFFSTKKMDRLRGSGLGLSVVHGIVEDHMGYITVDTVVGRGTAFSLFFPAARDVVLKEREPALELLRGNETILVIDDDPTQRRVLKQVLERLGYAATTLGSGEEAVALLRQHPHQLLIIDMVMDGIDGAETYRQILEFAPTQKAIILSGYAMTQRVQEALHMGAGSFISKPVIFKELANAVRHELDRKSP
ncbi:MAG TPA: PAS domain S-box protein [bacterium]